MTNIQRKVKWLTLVVVSFLLIFILINFHDITAQQIVEYTPNNYLVAFFMLMGIYAIKSLSVFIPLPVLYVSCTLIFTSTWAIIVNLFGLVVCMSIPYIIGRYSASDFVKGIIHKYPKISKIYDIKKDNEFVFTFVVKLMGFIPNDISSLLLGSLKVKYFKFLIASILVRTPIMVFTTITGLNFLNDEESSIIVIGILLLISAIILYLLYGKYKRKL